MVRLRAKHTEGFDPRRFARAEAAAVWSRPVAFAPQPWALEVALQLLGGCVPACLFARLFTSSLNSASARPRALADVAGRPDGPGEGSTESVSPDPLASVAVLDGFWFVPGGGLPDSATGLRPTCAPSTSGIPLEMLSRNVPRSILYTPRVAKVSGPGASFFS